MTHLLVSLVQLPLTPQEGRAAADRARLLMANPHHSA